MLDMLQKVLFVLLDILRIFKFKEKLKFFACARKPRFDENIACYFFLCALNYSN
jgi:hypothetical protein